MSNRPKTQLILLSLLLVAGLTFSCSAVTLEIAGGGLFTTLALPELNKVIDDFNSEIEEIQEELEEEGVTVTKMNNINSGFGFYGGAKLNLNRSLGVGAYFDNFSAGTGTKIESDEYNIDFELNIDLSVNGSVAVLSFDLNDYIGVHGGGGYYFGSLSMSAKGDIGEDIDEDEIVANLTGLGYKVGGTFNYPLTGQATLSSSVNYRSLQLGVASTNELTTIETDTLDANGIEVKVGISF